MRWSFEVYFSFTVTIHILAIFEIELASPSILGVLDLFGSMTCVDQICVASYIMLFIMNDYEYVASLLYGIGSKILWRYVREAEGGSLENC